MGSGGSRPEFDEKTCKECQAVTRHFDVPTLRVMHEAWHKAAPSGEMTVEHFGTYLANIMAAGTGRVRENKRWAGDIQIEAAKLFRGYNLNGDHVMTFLEYIVSQEAVCHHTDALPDVVFRILDRDLDGVITLEDVVALTQGVETIDYDDQFIVPIMQNAEGLWAYLRTTSVAGEGSCSRDRFVKICEEWPELHIKLLKLV